MEERKSIRPLRVLAVDDNVDTADSFALLLQLWGHEARVAYDGPAALASALVYRPDVVLLDIALPGLDGYQVARQLQQRTVFKDTFLVAITGYAQKKDCRRSREAGFHVHLAKPVDPERLRKLLAAFQRFRRTRPELASPRSQHRRDTPTLVSGGCETGRDRAGLLAGCSFPS